MITKEEYLKAKAIVDQYEHDEWEEKQRQVEEELSWEDEMMESECSICGLIEGVDCKCEEYDPLDYKVCGYG
jgi:hypothetical protein